jgi:N6-adenosine-specific RNA methylase IME4
MSNFKKLPFYTTEIKIEKKYFNLDLIQTMEESENKKETFISFSNKESLNSILIAIPIKRMLNMADKSRCQHLQFEKINKNFAVCSNCRMEFEVVDKKYKIIYADPPWTFKNKNTGGSMSSGSANQYKTMSIDEICCLNIRDISDENAVLFMWWVASMPLEAIKVIESWGFTLKTMTAFTWIKKTTTWKDFFGMGFYSRQQCEQCLVALKGKPKVLNHSVRQIIRAENRKHSKKPIFARENITTMFGKLPRIELFAREKIDGWDSWGDEIENSDIKISNFF